MKQYKSTKRKLRKLWTETGDLENKVQKERSLKIAPSPSIFQKSIKYCSIVENIKYTDPFLYEKTFEDLSLIILPYLTVVTIFKPDTGYDLDLETTLSEGYDGGQIYCRSYWKQLQSGLSLRIWVSGTLAGYPLDPPVSYQVISGTLTIKIFLFNQRTWHEIQHTNQ